MSSSRESPACNCIKLLTIIPTYLDYSDPELLRNSYPLLQPQLKCNGTKLNEFQEHYLLCITSCYKTARVSQSICLYHTVLYHNTEDYPILHQQETQLFISLVFQLNY